MNGELSETGQGDGATGLRKRLDEAVVLMATVAQLRKDLRAEELREPPVGEGAFEELRAQVLAVLAEREREGAHAFGLVVNRVDLTEHQLRTIMSAGGLHTLAGAVVLRCLQKVLSRMRFAGLG
ncbi:MAG: hypothetical protein JST38_15320 [Bacteroidetes bacterium]|nr:hypothetical protein [Bacteroidota bacterium]MBS1942239.1 hypothetical protein [Bacteroidota bacterium]